MVTLHEKLRDGTASAHERLEASAFQRGLQAGSIGADAVRTYLRCLAVIHGELERCLGNADDPRVAKIWNDGLAKLPLLRRDLAAAGEGASTDDAKALAAARALADRIGEDAGTPVHLLGHLYVLEGSQNGGVFLRALYARALNLPPERLEYFGAYGNRTRIVWKEFVERLNALTLGDQEAAGVVRSASVTFEGFGTLLRAIAPSS